MNSKIVAGVVTILFLIQTITAQCIGSLASPWTKSLAYAPEISTGGSFAVRSASPIAPTGVAVLSDQLVIEGPLIIDGKLPFLGTVALEGTLPSAGVGNVAHSCGGAVGISDIVPAAGIPVAPLGVPSRAPALGGGPIGVSPLGYGGVGLGCGRRY